MKTLNLDNKVYQALEAMALREKKSLSKIIWEWISERKANKKDPIASQDLAHLSSQGGSFDFLSNPKEDLYTEKDGEAA